MIFLMKKKEGDIFLIFAQNIDCVYTLERFYRVLTIYVIGQNKNKNAYPCKTKILLFKSGV